MQSSTRSDAITFLYICAMGFGAALSASWMLENFNLGMEVAGLTKNALVYYFAGMVMSAGVLLTSKAARKVGFYLAFYPFGLICIFSAGFTSTFEPNELLEGLGIMQIFMLQLFVWAIPAVVTGYFLLKSWHANKHPVDGK